MWLNMNTEKIEPLPYDKWMTDPTPENMAEIVKSMEPTINSEVQRYTGPKPLLRGKAKALTINAIKSYKPGQGTQLRSWVVTSLQPLSRYGQQLRPVHASEVAIRQAAQVNRVREEMLDETGHDPTPEELADQTGISVIRIKKLRQQVKPTISESAFDVSNDPNSPGLPGTIAPDRIGMAADMVYHSLSERDKQIHDFKTGKHGVPAISNQEIAKRLGVSPALISQRTAQIAAQIQDLYNRKLV